MINQTSSRCFGQSYKSSQSIIIPTTLLLCLLIFISLHSYGQTNLPNGTTLPTTGSVSALARPTYTTSGMKVNVVKSFTSRIPGININQLGTYPHDSLELDIQYMDGLGRVIQVVQRRASANSKDLVQSQYYDENGRSHAQYLPYVSSTTTGVFQSNPFNSQYTYHRTKTEVSHPDLDYFYGYQELENSPRARALSSAQPGISFVGSGKKVNVEYLFNTSGHGIRIWKIDYLETAYPTTSATYANNELTIQKTTDEDGNISLSYLDIEGKLILERRQAGSGTNLATASDWLSTYYVYDERGRLRAVIPPLAEQYLRANSWNMGSITHRNVVAKYRYLYVYDEKDRLIAKKLPAIADGVTTSGIHYVYDAKNQLVMQQDDKQRANFSWTVYQYDNVGRIIKVGVKNYANSSFNRDYHQGQINSTPTSVYPSLSVSEIEEYSYYDDYDFDDNGMADHSFNTSYNSKFATAPVSSDQTHGQLTGSKVRVLGTNDFNTSVYFYDNMGRVVQEKLIHHLGGTNYTTMAYDFKGNLIRSYEDVNQPQSDIGASFTLQQDYTFDHRDRLLTIHHEINDGVPVEVLAQTYEPLGQLKTKSLGDDLQEINYKYNVNNWLTHINDANLSNSDDLFGMELYYNFGYQTTYKNGNISGVQWKSASDEVKRNYGFLYDQLGRLNHADYRAHNGSNWTSLESGRYSVNNITYDANGNIMALQRQGLLNSTGTPSYGQIDSLSYSYDGNRLKAVNDTINQTNGVGDFKDRTIEAIQYTYDANGNLITDLNKEISHIRYNRLNLPDSIRKSDGNSISYRYDAQGNKLSQRVWSGSTLQHTRHYLGNYFYENDTLQHIQFGDGRIVYNPAVYGYEYHYYHKDHLGNIRQVFRAESTTTYMATMEPENETQEMQQYFHNLSDSRSIDARYNQTEGGRAVAYLDASRGRDYGPVWSKELAQGDSLHAAVLGMLYDPKEKPKLKDLLTGIGRQNVLRLGLEGANLTGTSSLGLQPLWLALQLARQLEKAPVPESYLGYILYDQDSIRYDSGRVEISRQAFTNPEELALDITATQGGFVEVYVYNASSSPVWYDQFSISSSQAVIIQENHYYPFGMQIAGLELDLDSKNRYKFNENEVLNDFELDLYDFNARFYDPSIGRFMGVDELANHPNQITMSPYQFGWNNPILYNDPSGLCPECGSEEEQSSSDEEDVVDEGKVLDEIVITHTQTQHEKNLTAGYQLGIYSGHAAFFSHGVTQSVMFGAGFLFAPEVYLLNRIGQGAASAIRPIVQNLKSFSFATKGGKELFNFSTKAAEHMANPGRAVPVQILEQAIKGSKGLADPRGSRALMHTTEMFKNGKRYNLEVLYDKATNSIWHFKYSPIKP
ncbi:DUF6443 domain-containing protein [Peijinzhouia sedimentorum]